MAPERWPDPPLLVSHSAIIDLEACPRRWALHNASFDLDRRIQKYPRRPSVAALFGRVVHRSLEVISDACEVESSSEDELLNVLRRLGGISAVVRVSREEILADLATNQRARRVEGSLREHLQRDESHMRLVVQLALSVAAQDLRTPRAAAVQSPRPAASEAPLGAGHHAEVRIAADSLGWTGIADAIVISRTECKILDYKSGSADVQHEEQLLEYATIWFNDKVHNPNGRLASALTLIYPGRTVDVQPPSEGAIAAIGTDMTRRASSARRLASGGPPAANVAPENCGFCDVKHMCEPFWSSGRGVGPAAASEDFVDVEVLVVGRAGDRSWKLQILAGGGVPPGTRAVMTLGSDRTLGERLRILSAIRSEGETSDVLLSEHSGTEVFACEIARPDA